MTAPWLENWRADGGYVHVPDEDRDGFFGEKSSYGGSCPSISLEAMERDEDRASLAAAAPALVRALLAVEFSPDDDHHRCPWCGGASPDNPGIWHRGHMNSCRFVALMKEVGLPDQASRDVARAEIAKRKP